MASITYNEARKRIMDGTLNLSSDTLKVMLVSSAYTPNKDDQFVSSGGSTPGAAELNGTGYTSGFGSASRKTIGSKTFTRDDTNDAGVFDAADVSWTAINAGTVAGVLVIKEGTTNADSLLIAYHDVSPDSATNGGDWTYAWDNTAGVLRLV